MSQAEFGALFGRSQRDISFFESDIMVPPREFLVAVAVRFNDEVLSAYVCGMLDRDMMRAVVCPYQKPFRNPPREKTGKHDWHITKNRRAGYGLPMLRLKNCWAQRNTLPC